MKKLFFTLCALCLCGTMWADTIGEDIQKDATTGLYFATVTYDNATTQTVTAIIPAQNGESYTISNLVKNEDGTYTLPATVQAEGGEAVALQGVAASAFAEALTDTSNPIHLVIPANIINLGQEAFNKCTQIEEVTVEYSETALDEAHNTNYNSFNNCSNIKTVTLDRDISIHRNNDQYAYTCFTFCKLPSIQTVNIGEHVTTLANNAFNANGTTSQLSAVYCYTTTVPTLAYKCFNYLADGCKLYVYDELVDSFKADTKEHTYGTDTFGYGWGDIFSNIEGMGSVGLEEGTYKDIDTGLYFEVDEETGVVSIYHDEAGTYTDANLVVYSVDEEGKPNAYTLPETVSADGVTYYDVTRIEANAFASSSISGHLVIPANILYMGEGAFYGCTGLTEVTYEYSDTELAEEYATNNGGNYSFGGCTNVTTVNLYRNITLPHSKYIIGPFCATYAIKTLNIGPRVTALGDYLFHYAFSTSSTPVINCYAPVPFQLGYYSFDTGNNYTFYAPNGAATAYSTLEAASANHTAWNQSGTFTDMSNAFAITTNNGEDAAYATFYNSASAVEFFNADATVYAATSVKIEDGTGNVYIESLGSVVPAATAVLVETSEAQTMLAIATTEEATTPSTNYLYGFDTATTITTPADCVYYMLTYGTDSSLGFYWGVDKGGAFESAAHKAYLAIPNGIANNTSGISIKKDADGDTTGISSVEASEGAKVSGIYTIQGVRVSNMNQPGLYIVDGKKVMKR